MGEVGVPAERQRGESETETVDLRRAKLMRGVGGGSRVPRWPCSALRSPETLQHAGHPGERRDDAKAGRTVAVSSR